MEGRKDTNNRQTTTEERMNVGTNSNREIKK
jgi:hypothetical protein